MLRVLVLTLLPLCSVLSNSLVEYQEPDAKALQKQNVISNQLIDQAKHSQHDPEIQKLLATGRKKMSQMNFRSGQNFYQLPDQSANLAASNLINKVMGAGEIIDAVHADTEINRPLILVSFSMPEALIKQLIDEAAITESLVVLRGLYNNDIGLTVSKIGRLSPDQGNGVVIDPTYFSRFNVASVPAFVLPLEPISACSPQDCPTPRHVKAAGASTLRYFLDKVDRLGSEQEKHVASQWIERYEY